MSKDKYRNGSAVDTLTPNQLATLARLGYDDRFLRGLDRGELGAMRIAVLLEQAENGELSPRQPDTETSVRGEAVGIMTFWATALVGGFLFVIFTLGVDHVFSMVQGQNGDEDARFLPHWLGVLFVVGPFLVFDVVARWRGRHLIAAMPGARRSDAWVRPSHLGFLPVPPVLQELACLPLLTLPAIILAQTNVPHPANSLLQILTLILLGATGCGMVLAGGPLFASVLVAVWAGWAWIALHGNSTLVTIALLVFTLAVGALYFGRVIKALSSRDAQRAVQEHVGP